MKLEPKKISGNLPRDQDIDWLPTEPPIDERPFADSASDLAQGVDVVEIPADGPATMSDPSMSGAWRPLTSAEQAARELGVQARRDGALPDNSPFEPGTALDLCWLDGYRATQ